MDIQQFTMNGKEITLYQSVSENSPLVVFNNHMESGKPILNALHELNCPDINLLCIGSLNWDHDLSPWHCPPI